MPAEEGMSIFSITPNFGATRGGERITIRGKGFSDGSIKVSFTSSSGTVVLDGLSPSFVSSKVCEVSSPSFPRNLNKDDKNWLFVTITCGGQRAKGRRKFKYLEKCSVVRKCLQVEGHPGRCCSDPPLPLYGVLASPTVPGGKIGTALLGYRCKDKHKKNSLPGPRPPPERKPIPGGVIARTPRKCATGPIGGLDDARLKAAKESTASVIILPSFGHDIPGGKIGTALLGYRCKDKHKANSMPGPRPPPERKPIPGGVIAQTPRVLAVGFFFFFLAPFHLFETYSLLTLCIRFVFFFLFFLLGRTRW
jgi:hypothetical protein